MRNREIDDAIALMAGRRRAFSAKDIADFEEWDGLESYIEKALCRQCQQGTVIRLDGADTDDSYTQYLSAVVARNWWTNLTLRLVETNVDYVTSAQLAKSLSLAFGNGCKWDAPPNSLLDVGREWALIADGCVPDTYVFPWVTLIRWDCRFKSFFPKLLFWRGITGITIKSSLDDALSRLRKREARIIRLRFGLSDGRKHTLEEVGREFGVTRERIRQIEAKALRRLRDPTRQLVLWPGIVAAFVRSSGSLLKFESERTPAHFLLDSILQKKTECVPELGVNVITDVDLSNFREYISDYDGHKLDDQKLAAFLPFLSKADVTRLRKPIEELKEDVVARWTRPRMLLETLRSLGRAAHFQEIAQLCNEMFPERQNSIHNWHSALGQPSAEGLGIVWIGRKGMYGLKEHGYQRPRKDLFDSAADIVEKIYSESKRPVLDEAVIDALSKIRREVHPNSVKMALSFSERLESVGGGRYVPISALTNDFASNSSPNYDISAAVEAFSMGEDSEQGRFT